MKTLHSSTQGIYHKQSRLHWYAIAFVKLDGEPFLVAAKTPKKAINLAKKINPDVKGDPEMIVIRRKPNPTQP